MVQEKEKRTYVQKVCDKLNAAGFREKSRFSNELSGYTPDEGFGKSLFWLPLENLERMVYYDISECETFGKAYQLWGRAGLLKFKPYITDDNDNPTLVVRRDRFIHMFRGYYFQASGTVDGIGDYGNGAYRTDFITQVPYYNELLLEGFITYMLWWAALINVGFSFDGFVDLFNNDIEVLNEFLRRSMEYWGIEQNRSWSDVEKYITHEIGNIDVTKRKVYQLLDLDGHSFCRMAMGYKTIQVEISGNNLYTLTIPDLNLGVDYNLDNEDDKDEFDSQVDILKENHYTEMLLTMLLALCGFNISFCNWWSDRKDLETMPYVNSPDVINVESLNDIYNQEPDMF